MNIQEVSIVIPTRNEEGNIITLIQRIHESLSSRGITYEVIFIDDHSTDGTVPVIKAAQAFYPIQYYQKVGNPGKAQSLIEGFEKANYSLLCMIDGDLQYPPEIIPEMMQKISDGMDIIVANRKEHEDNNFRNVLSKVFVRSFGKKMHNFDVDVQSGLKVFRRSILERFSLNPYPWTFDMEFLKKARNAGYKIGSVDITFAKRNSGKSKVKVLSASLQIAYAALLMKLKSDEVVPFGKDDTERIGQGFHYKGNRFIHYTSLNHNQTAFFRFNAIEILVGVLLIVLLSASLLFNWHTTIVLIVGAMTFLYFADLVFNLFLIYRSFANPPELHVPMQKITEVPDYAWPKYTILCPLYKEWDVVPQFINSMNAMDYPKEKLQIMFLLEEDDTETIEKIKEYQLPFYYEVAVIPHSLPKTKPKALNYGLTKATGEYLVVYDAEDVPEPLQLKKAVIAFQNTSKNTVCIQAKLNFYNPSQNILTRVFTAEYSLWFDLVLTGLQSIKAPIPLGGTSNHFRTKDLYHLKGWDSFNVTEDCDLGMRLVKQGFKTEIIDSMTMEEANSNLLNWYRQRTRWIKGYIQTYFVHMRNPQEFRNTWKNPHLLLFQLVVGGKITSMFINPIMWVLTISYFLFRPIMGPFIESFFPPVVFYMGVFSLAFGNFLYMYYYMIGCAKREYDSIIKYTLLVPFYWLAMSVAAWNAVYQMIKNPHYWPKTVHGLHLKKTQTHNTPEREKIKLAMPERKAAPHAPIRFEIPNLSVAN